MSTKKMDLQLDKCSKKICLVRAGLENTDGFLGLAVSVIVAYRVMSANRSGLERVGVMMMIIVGDHMKFVKTL